MPTSKVGANDCSSIVNSLPCRVHHDGYICQTAGFWNPSKSSGENQRVYFRGRKLIGRCLRVPEEYRGAVVQIENDDPRHKDSLDITSTEDRTDVEVIQAGQNLHVTSTFEEIRIWTHGPVSHSPDQYTKCVEEWLYAAERIDD